MLMVTRKFALNNKHAWEFFIQNYNAQAIWHRVLLGGDSGWHAWNIWTYIWKSLACCHAIKGSLAHPLFLAFGYEFTAKVFLSTETAEVWIKVQNCSAVWKSWFLLTPFRSGNTLGFKCGNDPGTKEMVTVADDSRRLLTPIFSRTLSLKNECLEKLCYIQMGFPSRDFEFQAEAVIEENGRHLRNRRKNNERKGPSTKVRPTAFARSLHPLLLPRACGHPMNN